MQESKSYMERRSTFQKGHILDAVPRPVVIILELYDAGTVPFAALDSEFALAIAPLGLAYHGEAKLDKFNGSCGLLITTGFDGQHLPQSMARRWWALRTRRSVPEPGSVPTANRFIPANGRFLLYVCRLAERHCADYVAK